MLQKESVVEKLHTLLQACPQPPLAPLLPLPIRPNSLVLARACLGVAERSLLGVNLALAVDSACSAPVNTALLCVCVYFL